MQQTSFIRYFEPFSGWCWSPCPPHPLAHTLCGGHTPLPPTRPSSQGDVCFIASCPPEVSPARSLVLGFPLHTAWAWGLL